MRIHSLEHVAEEGLGSIATWAEEHEHLVTRTRFYLNDIPPQPSDFDLLVIMGGPMSVNDITKYLWLEQELKLIAASIAAGKLILGICLGAQLIAKALGAEVRKNDRKEIGWFPLTITEDGRRSNLFSCLPTEPLVFHWHGETFALPIGARHLAQSAACKHQAFSYGADERVLALQFHLEINSQTIASIEPDLELKQDDFVQTREQMLALSDNCTTVQTFMAGILDRLCKPR